MRIGILSLPIHGNYGGVLQNFALYSVLKLRGYQVMTIDYKKAKHLRIKQAIFRLIRRCGGAFFVQYVARFNPKFALLYYIRDFADKYIEFSITLKSSKELEMLSSEYDIFIVGSDQVWRKIFIYDDIGSYFLSFLVGKSQKRFSYAASLGTDDIEYNAQELKYINSLIKDFCGVSVREQSSISLIRDAMKWQCKEPQFTLDPTFLLEKEDYLHLIREAKVKEPFSFNLFYYVLDINEEKEERILNLADRLNLKPYTIYFSDKKKARQMIKQGLTPTVEQWLLCISHADFVVTDSYHGMVFSIIFNKQFLVWENKERGAARFNSLLDILEIRNRFISLDDPVSIESMELIDYEKVNRLLYNYKMQSLNFLNNQLNL